MGSREDVGSEEDVGIGEEEERTWGVGSREDMGSGEDVRIGEEEERTWGVGRRKRRRGEWEERRRAISSYWVCRRFAKLYNQSKWLSSSQ